MIMLREELNGFDQVEASRIRLGASQQACCFFLPPLVKEFKKLFSHCRFEVYGEDTPKCLEMLSSDKLDLAITLEPFKNIEIDFVPCFSDELRSLLTKIINGQKNKPSIGPISQTKISF